MFDTERSLVVAAGAGSGKTRVLVGRYLHLLEAGLADLDEIIAITFTEKAATEMKGRVWSAIVQRQAQAQGAESVRWRDLSRRLASQARISTIHSFCARLIRDYPMEAGVDPNFTILEPLEAKQLIRKATIEAIETLILSGDENMGRLVADFGVAAVVTGLSNVYEKMRATGRPVCDFLDASIANLRRHAVIARDELHSRWGSIIQSLDSASVDTSLLDSLDWDSPSFIDDFMRIHSTARTVRGVINQTDLNDIARTFESLAASFLHVDLLCSTVGSIAKACSMVDGNYLRLRGNGAVLDFTCLELHARDLLRDTDAGERSRRQLKFIMVDEYQDTNGLQNEIVTLLAGDPPGNRLFIVGDVKQSIYAFRGAEVEVFKGAMAKANEGTGDAGIEILGRNFRSVDALVELANCVFSAPLNDIWTENSTAARPVPDCEVPRTELHVITHRRDSQESAVGELAEADLVASRIARMVEAQEQLICEHDMGEFTGTRPVRYRDVAILLRTTRRIGNFEAALARHGVPYYVVSGRGFYGQPEVTWVMNMLKAVHDPWNGVAIASVLRHPVFGLSDESLLRLALSGGVTHAFTTVEPEPHMWGAEEAEKLLRAKDCMKRLWSRAGRLGPGDMVREILDAIQFVPYLALDSDGPQLIANVNKLVEMAKKASASALSISDFIKLIDQAADDNADESEAALMEEDADVVRLMTVHKSKGLEFPVVFVPELVRSVGSKHPPLFQFAADMGIAVPISQGLPWHRTSFGIAMKGALESAAGEESMRCLYVAATRASDYMVLSSTMNDKADIGELDQSAQWLEPFGRAISESTSGACDGIVPLGPDGRVTILVKKTSVLDYEFREGKAAPSADSHAPSDRSAGQLTPALVGPVRASADPDYPFQVSVSGLMCLARCPRWYVYEYVLGLERIHRNVIGSNRVGSEVKLNAAQRGQIVHAVCQWARSEEQAKELLVHHLKAYGLCDEALERMMMNLWPLVCNYLSSPEASASGMREQSFLLDLGESVVSGIVDFVSVDENKTGLVMDLKTNTLDESDIENAAEDYRVQMDSYALAVHRGLGAERVTTVLNFLYPNLRVSNDYDETEFARAERRLNVLAQAAADCVFERTVPEWSRHCKVCYYARLCWPGKNEIGVDHDADDYHVFD